MRRYAKQDAAKMAGCANGRRALPLRRMRRQSLEHAFYIEIMQKAAEQEPAVRSAFEHGRSYGWQAGFTPYPGVSCGR